MLGYSPVEPVGDVRLVTPGSGEGEGQGRNSDR